MPQPATVPTTPAGSRSAAPPPPRGSGPALIALAGIFVAGVLSVRGHRGTLLAGVAAATVLGLVSGSSRARTG
jgi:xanthine/uracil/vitamin C permease (AzgA family)